jgi:mono/diheme cytochrome c family protein
MMWLKTGVVCTTLGLLLLSGTVGPAQAADPTTGSRLARQWCASCHLVSDRATPSIQQGPPPFKSIAQARSAEELRTFLSQPHGAMPNLDLSRAEIDDLIAYIQSLR